MKISKANANELLDYVSRFGYFRNGMYCADYEGQAYEVEKILNIIHSLKLAA